MTTSFALKLSAKSLDPEICKICTEEKSRDAMFHKNSCSHSFCSDCISKHVTAKVQLNVSSITCPFPNCEGILQPEDCKYLIRGEVFDRWMNALCESAVAGLKKCYCPFKDCSEMLVNDDGEVVTKSECPNCQRLFCAKCNVSWHSETSCENFQMLGEDERGREDIMLMKLAKEKNWSRCPNCKFYIEKRDGCQHITCFCGYQFCYGCGIKWIPESHGGCQGPWRG